MRNVTDLHLEEFALEGLRTLVMGQKNLIDEEYNQFNIKFDALKKSGSDSEKEAKINQLFDDMEKNLDFVGCTAIEDKLQDNVPETIS